MKRFPTSARGWPASWPLDRELAGDTEQLAGVLGLSSTYFIFVFSFFKYEVLEKICSVLYKVLDYLSLWLTSPFQEPGQLLSIRFPLRPLVTIADVQIHSEPKAISLEPMCSWKTEHKVVLHEPGLCWAESSKEVCTAVHTAPKRADLVRLFALQTCLDDPHPCPPRLPWWSFKAASSADAQGSGSCL